MCANAAASGVSCQSVCTWVDRYLVEGLASLTDKSHRSSVCPHWVTGDAKRSDLARPAGFEPATGCLEDFMPLSCRLRMGETWGAPPADVVRPWRCVPV